MLSYNTINMLSVTVTHEQGSQLFPKIEFFIKCDMRGLSLRV